MSVIRVVLAVLALNAGRALAQTPTPSPHTHTVTDFNDTGAAGQLRTLIAAADPGDTIVIPLGTVILQDGPVLVIDPDGTTHIEGGELAIKQDLNIAGAGVAGTIIDGGGTHRVFNVATDAVVTISGLTVRNGSDPTDFGGGIANGGVLTLRNVSLTANVRGGGLYNFGTATLRDVTIDRNRAAGSGGGIFNGGDLTLTGVTISRNSAGAGGLQRGGGIFSLVGGGRTVALTNVTMSANTAITDGGAMYTVSDDASTVTLMNVTIGNNAAAGQGSGIFTLGPITLENVIVANSQGVNCDGNGFVSRGHNVANDRSCQLTAVGDLADTDPKLGLLQDNGGPTETQALLPNSPAIDAGDDSACPDTDQRGARRPVDGNGDGVAACDIGAYELQLPCAGDCNANGSVTIDELVLMVDIALGQADAIRCHGGAVTIAEIVRAVEAAASGCAAS